MVTILQGSTSGSFTTAFTGMSLDSVPLSCLQAQLADSMRFGCMQAPLMDGVPLPACRLSLCTSQGWHAACNAFHTLLQCYRLLVTPGGPCLKRSV